MRRRMRNRLLAVAMAVGVASCALVATAQEPGEQVGGRTQFAGMERVVGTVVSVAGDVVTVKAEDGSVYKLATTPNTRLIKGQAPVKVADLRPATAPWRWGW